MHRFGDRVQVTTIKGRGGVFDVRVGEECVYSKARTFRFPGVAEAISLIEEHL